MKYQKIDQPCQVELYDVKGEKIILHVYESHWILGKKEEKRTKIIMNVADIRCVLSVFDDVAREFEKRAKRVRENMKAF